MTTQAAPVDLTAYNFWQPCDLGCEREAIYVAKGCMDKDPVMMCEPCLKRGLDVVRNAVKMYQRCNKRVMVCGDCHRPLLNLETHIDIRRL